MNNLIGFSAIQKSRLFTFSLSFTSKPFQKIFNVVFHIGLFEPFSDSSPAVLTFIFSTTPPPVSIIYRLFLSKQLNITEPIVTNTGMPVVFTRTCEQSKNDGCRMLSNRQSVFDRRLGVEDFNVISQQTIHTKGRILM